MSRQGPASLLMKDTGCVLWLPYNSLWRKKGKKRRRQKQERQKEENCAREVGVKQVFINGHVNSLPHYYSELFLIDCQQQYAIKLLKWCWLCAYPLPCC